MKWRRRVKGRIFKRLRQLRHGPCMSAIQSVNRTNDLGAFEQGMVVGACRHVLSVSNWNAAGFFKLNSFPFLYQGWSTTQWTSSQLDTTVGCIGVNMGQHPCGTAFDTLKSPCPDELRLFWGQKRLHLNIRTVVLMFCTPRIYIHWWTFFGGIYG
jgi:hypothetical protein